MPDIQWPDDPKSQIEFVPEEWTETTQSGTRIRGARQKHLPEKIFVATDGAVVPKLDNLRIQATPAG